MPKLSVIIPTLNEERDLPSVLDCLKAQDFKDFEIIIADAGSTDKTRQIATEYGCRVVDGGMPAVGRNRGASAALGKWLLFLDADVFLPEKFITFMIDEAEEKQVDIASCGVVPLSDKTIDTILHGVANTFISLTQYFYPHAPGFCILARKSFHDSINGFDEKLKLAEDHEYVMRAQKAGVFKILKNPKVYVSVRRLDADGRLNVAAKYVACEAYRLLIGEVKTDIFKYKFGHHYDSIKSKMSLNGKLEKIIDKIKNRK